jgi:hypothetical protein
METIQPRVAQARARASVWELVSALVDEVQRFFREGALAVTGGKRERDGHLSNAEAARIEALNRADKLIARFREAD